MLTSLREYYQPHAVANYASAADYYDGLAQKFTAAADLVDPETDAAAMVDEPEKTAHGRGVPPSSWPTGSLQHWTGCRRQPAWPVRPPTRST